LGKGGEGGENRCCGRRNLTVLVGFGVVNEGGKEPGNWSVNGAGWEKRRGKLGNVGFRPREAGHR